MRQDETSNRTGQAARTFSNCGWRDDGRHRRFAELLQREYPFSTLKGSANVLIFPDLNSANITYKLLMKIGGAEAIGPILMGMSKPVYVLPEAPRWKTS
jgi:hypothetical protein